MTDQTLGVVSGAEEGGETVLPGQKASPPQAPLSATDADKLMKLLNPIIDAAVDRRFQSGKDKRIAQLEGKNSEFQKKLERLETLEAAGLKREQALNQMELESDVAALKQAVQGKSASVSDAPAGNPEDKGTANADPVLSSMITALGIDPNSPEVTAILREEGDLSSRIQKVVALKAGGQAISGAVQPGQRLPGGTGASAPVTNIDSIVSEMQKLQANPSKDWKRYEELSAELKKQGIG